MTLYTVPVPQPAAGADWQYPIPGIYLERITGITAQLTTGAGPTVCVDSSGNGHNGTYDGAQIFILGAIPGDDGVQLGPATGFNGFSNITIPPVMPDLTQPFSFEWWHNKVRATGNINQSFAYSQGPVGGGNPALVMFASQTSATDGQIEIDAYTIHWASVVVTNLFDGNWHHIVITSDGATEFTIYVDGAVVTSSEVGGPNPFTNFAADEGWIAGPGLRAHACTGSLDEAAVYNQELVAATVQSHFLAAGSFAGYTATILADTPVAYYHLDQSVSTGRTPGLEITDGTHTVERIPDGFTAQTTPGPYLYSWLPNLANSTRDPTGVITSVAIPNLILPGGYTVGTRTPDLQSSDQWSDVIVWWNDDVQQGTLNFDPYAFPGGILLRYQREEVPA